MLEKFFARPLVRGILKLMFRMEVRGLEHVQAAGDRVLIVCNHVSYLDPLLLGAFMPFTPAFAINVFQADKWYFRWLDKAFKLYKLDPSRPMTMKALIQDLRKGAHVAIFPEGRISTSGGIMKIYDGTSLLIEKTGATVLPVRVDGAEFSKFSRMGGKLRQRWFPSISITFLPPITFEEGVEVPAEAVYKLMADAAFHTSPYRARNLLEAVLNASDAHGPKKSICFEATRTSLSYRNVFTRAFVLSGKLSQPLMGEKHVGVLLPTVNAGAVTFMALQAMSKVPCMLNFSAGESNILHACRIATVKTVLTSRAFVEKGKLEPVMEAIAAQCKVIYLEDFKDQVTLGNKLSALFKAFFAREFLGDALARQTPSDAAVVLFTSGSEGTPKGVALSHDNLLSNIAQVSATLDITASDVLFNAMPVFHSFGLTVGLVLPLVRGVKTFLYPSPLHYRVIPELVYDTDATIMLGTDTFFNGYAHYGHAYDFHKIRLAVAGAEKLKDATRRLYADKFRVNILEGYGVTETSPVLSFNTPLYNRIGSVGKALPGVETKLEPVEGLEVGGKLLVKGPNVMLGYLKADQPGVIQPHGEWYDTGDIVDIDAQGYISILGRAKRFAKIAGEMVSLAAVEEFVSAVVPDKGHAAVAIGDAKKGEQVLLFTESEAVTRELLQQHAKKKGVPELGLPRQVQPIGELPRLGNGKIDYVALAKLAKELKDS
ncbi:MAG: AMP-binding protein [Rickettsiales bacterium]|nr:AMP-binding protein [Rickettsiales bacterium]